MAKLWIWNVASTAWKKVSETNPLPIIWQDAKGNEAPIGTEEDPINVVDVTLTGVIPTSIDKDVTTAGIPERLVDESTIVKKAYLTAKRSNVGYVAVGDSGVDAAEATEMGKSLESEDFIVLENVDLYECWLDSVEDGEGITILATVEPSE